MRLLADEKKISGNPKNFSSKNFNQKSTRSRGFGVMVRWWLYERCWRGFVLSLSNL